MRPAGARPTIVTEVRGCSCWCANSGWRSASPCSACPMLRNLGRALVVLTVVTFALAALATIPLILPAGLWQGLVLVGAAASLTLMTVFVLRSLVIGLTIDVVLIVAVLGGAWTPELRG